jgi:hypothetical protein
MGSSYSYPEGPVNCRADPSCDPLIDNARNPGIIVLFAFWGVALATFCTYYLTRTLATGDPKVLHHSISTSFYLYLYLIMTPTCCARSCMCWHYCLRDTLLCVTCVCVCVCVCMYAFRLVLGAGVDRFPGEKQSCQFELEAVQIRRILIL